MDSHVLGLAVGVAMAAGGTGYLIGARSVESPKSLERECPSFNAEAERIRARIVGELHDGEWRGQPLISGASHVIVTEELHERACLSSPAPYHPQLRLNLAPTVCTDGRPPGLSVWLGRASDFGLDCTHDRFDKGHGTGNGKLGAGGRSLRTQGDWTIALKGPVDFIEHPGDWYGWADSAPHGVQFVGTP